MPSRPPDLTVGSKRGLLPADLGAIVEFIDGDEKDRKVPIIFTRTVFGRKFGDIFVRDIRVSATHAALEFRGGAFRLIDLGSSNGTFIGDRKIHDALLEPGEEAKVGSTRFRLRFDPVMAAKLSAQIVPNMAATEGGLADILRREFLQGGKVSVDATAVTKRAHVEVQKVHVQIVSGPDRGQKKSFKKNKITIGRVETDIVLHDTDVSRKHALLEVQEDQQILLRDLASTNGTFMNDRRITNAIVKPTDQIRIGSTVLVVSTVESK